MGFGWGWWGLWVGAYDIIHSWLIVYRASDSIFHYNHKSISQKWQLEIFVIKHPLYICLLFHLPLKIILLLYGEYIVHLHRQCERGVIGTEKMCIYVIRKNMYITLHIFLFIPFSVPFRFPFCVLVTPNGHECRTNRSMF